MFAALINARAEDVAIVPAVSAGAGIVAANLPPATRGDVPVPVADADATLARRRAAGVAASARAGRVRLSVHLDNDEDEIDRAVELVAAG